MTLPARLPDAHVGPPRCAEARPGRSAAGLAAASQRVGVVLDAVSPGTRLPPLAVLLSGMSLLAAFGWRLGGPVVALILGAMVTALPVAGPAIVRRQNDLAAHRLLPERVAGVARSLRSGTMLPDALLSAFHAGAVGTEHWVAGMRQVELGRSLDEVLLELAPSADSQQRMVIAVLRMGERSGGRPAASLESLAVWLREEVDLTDRRRVLTTQARVSAQVLAGLPVVFAMVLAVVRGGTAYTGSIGVASLIGGSLLNVVGLAWMRRQLRVLQ